FHDTYRVHLYALSRVAPRLHWRDALRWGWIDRWRAWHLAGAVSEPNGGDTIGVLGDGTWKSTAAGSPCPSSMPMLNSPWQTPSAFGKRCIPPRCVAQRLKLPV